MIDFGLAAQVCGICASSDNERDALVRVNEAFVEQKRVTIRLLQATEIVHRVDTIGAGS
jgi:hypothetical protein